MAASLAYIRRQSDGKGSELAVSVLDGSDARALLSADSRYPFLRSPAWSPDGRTIAIVRGTGGIAGEMWLVPSEGGSPQAATHEPETVFSDWPNFTRRRARADPCVEPRRRDKHLVAAAFRGRARPTHHRRRPDESPSLGRDGTIAYVNSRWQNTLDIHDLKNRSSRTLVTHTPFIWAPAVSPDGQRNRLQPQRS